MTVCDRSFSKVRLYLALHLELSIFDKLECQEMFDSTEELSSSVSANTLSVIGRVVGILAEVDFIVVDENTVGYFRMSTNLICRLEKCPLRIPKNNLSFS